MDLDLRKSGHGIGSNASLQSNLVLYSYCHSSCSWRIRFALSLKGIPYEYKAVDLSKGEQYSPEFERLNPLHYVPVLVDDNVVVSDSYAIFLHLEEKYTQKPLLPVDPQLRALNLQVASIIHSSIQPLHMLNVLNQNHGPNLPLTKVSQADVFLAPQITLAVQRFDIDMSKFPTLSRLYETYKALPEFQASSPQRQPDALIHNP
ncbi:Glutathione S-transferase zeta class [Glycine max]|nr:Glutathione S-transferase zeta class [Glycine max]